MITGKNTTLRSLYNELCTVLQAADPHNAKNEAFWLLEAVAGCTRGQLLAGSHSPIQPQQAAQCHALAARRVAGEPLQYILGQWEFMGFPFAVGEGVLIPRPETEELVERVLPHLAQYAQPLVLDLCAGSGCIPISIARLCPVARCWGVELSSAAYSYFVRNLALNGVAARVAAIQGDALVPSAAVAARKYHLVTSNPPYIARDALAGLQAEVQREPAMALDGGRDGLDFYRILPSIAAGLLLPGGLLALETGEEQGPAVAALVAAAGFAGVAVHRDLYGNVRMVTGLLPY